MADNLIIEASAGTGKTETLARRLIGLVRDERVAPQDIVALTFSRMAAGEIFERFVMLLAADAEESPADADLLRRVIATQHLSQIGTIDSFLMRLVKSFPLELGLIGEIEMMDDYRAAVERSRTSFSILRRTDAVTKREFVDAFAQAMNHENVRSFAEAYRNFIAEWHELALSMADASAWGERPELPSAGVSDLEMAADAVVAALPDSKWREFSEWVRGFRGNFAAKGYARKLLDNPEVFKGGTIEFRFSRSTVALGGEQAKAVRAAMAAVYGYAIGRKRETIRGIWRLISAYEREYGRKIRRAGKLVFADVPRLILQLGSLDRQRLEYRLDARIRAWALDEFQDTSREQWKALSGLVDESAQSGGERSVLIVGDCKQAIYGWRNGDMEIFRAERDSGKYLTGHLDVSHRSGTAVIEAINRIFADGPLATEFPGWEATRHETACRDRVGFVQKVELARGEGKAKADDFVDPVFNALKAVDPVGRGISAAVLVRGNIFGERMADGLRMRGLRDVIWEGESEIYDTPALSGFLDLVQLADHPADHHAYAHFVSTPLAAVKYPDGVPSAEAVSAEMARSFVMRGIVRTFRELRALLPEAPNEAWSEFTEGRFTDMLRAASEFELSMEASSRLSDFSGYIRSVRRRTSAEPGKIRVMTVHHSKGLGFDYVVLPLYEPRGIEKETGGPLVGRDWILPDPGKCADAALPTLSVAADARRMKSVQEELSIYYVALTRAKWAMTVVMHPAAEVSATRRFSDIVRETLPDTIGESDWYRSFSGTAATERSAALPAPTRKMRRHCRRRLPSLAFQSGQSAGELFVSPLTRKAAEQRGIMVHEEYRKVEWIAADAARNGFERELVRPEGFKALWRERAFEILVDGVWVSGRFDRVVFAGDGALVIDFKTNRMQRNESVVEFERRMVEIYAEQMLAYRKAVAVMSGIVLEKVSAKLLLTATMSAVDAGI